MTPDPVKLAVAQAMLSRLPEVGETRDIALTGPTLVVEVVSRTALSATVRVRERSGLPRYFEIRITEKM
jgi:hypothetical protein